MKGLVFVGCGPGVGTTTLTGACALVLRRMHRAVETFKPIAIKCERRQRQGLVSVEAEFLAYCSDTSYPLEAINPVRLAGDLPPAAGAGKPGRLVDFRAIRRTLRNLQSPQAHLLIDGGPGLMWPVAPRRVLADLIRGWGLPVALVARSGEGAVNDLLVHATVAGSVGLEVSCTIINFYHPQRATLAEEAAAEIVAGYGGLDLPTIVPEDSRTDMRRGAVGPSVLFPLRVLMASLDSKDP